MLYWLLYFMFELVDYFSSITPNATVWHAVNLGGTILNTTLMGIPTAWVVESPLSPWHAARMLGGWLAHGAFLLVLAVWAFQFREAGLRE